MFDVKVFKPRGFTRKEYRVCSRCKKQGLKTEMYYRNSAVNTIFLHRECYEKQKAALELWKEYKEGNQ